ncbi:hypothetical protein HPP92_026854 [Vanilla planifolia]|uniref:Peptidase M3A/M3B catalytic domain-containing protein n=1 Tax=Vanilla planifolia TaxID=51239 RepID=A0A835PAX0_VANPL|nr:hypothetical protein HPP92_026854 [Vanilla planifolia]
MGNFLRCLKVLNLVLEFLEEVSNRLSGLATRELNFLKNLKVNEEGDTYFGMEDLLYYMRRAEELLISLDPAEVRQYFPVNLVLSGIFKIFQDLFGLKFEEVDGTEVWHETVHLYSVLDLSSSELLGFIYLDLFSREGKFTHTCVMSLQHGCMSSKGTRQIPVSLLISQCSKPVDESPVLIRFSDVISLFHEFTHLIHSICNRATYPRFSGLHMEGDFIEIPGQLLENWCYENVTLKIISGFHKDITNSMTAEMCKSLKRKRDLFSCLKLKQEILLCEFPRLVILHNLTA